MAEDVVQDRPVCRCHGVPQVRNGRDAWGVKWQCRIKNRARAKRWHDGLDHVQRSTRMLSLYLHLQRRKEEARS